VFSIPGASSSLSDAFLGLWIIPLDAHSDVLHQFGGVTVGSVSMDAVAQVCSLRPSRSAGCVRVDNSSLDGFMDSIGVEGLAGIPGRRRFCRP